jgi:diacylglycerol kinase family enzyme
MRAAAILGPGCSARNLKPFQADTTIDWHVAVPSMTDEVDAVLLFGGDGTIHRHLGKLVGLGRPVLIVPSGSGNDFARALGLRRVRDSVAAWRRYLDHATNVSTIDLGMIIPFENAGEASAPHGSSHNSRRGVRYFCCVAGVGLDGEVSRRASALPRWLRGHGGYALSLVAGLFRFAASRMKIQTAAASAPPGSAIETENLLDAAGSPTWLIRSNQPTILAAFANTPTYGGGMKIAPRARLDDGLLDACVIGGINPFKLCCMFPTEYCGRHLGIREVQYFQSNRIRIETETPLDVYADGEYVCRTPVEIAVAAPALRIIV